MTADALDTRAVHPDSGVFAERVAPCGCRGVPDGQHLPSCREGKGTRSYADRCPACTYRTADVRVGEVRRCAGCGAIKP